MTKSQETLERWYEKYVPMSGPAETVGGEIVRAVERLAFRWYNDGDMIFHGYGNTTANSSWRYLGKFFDAGEPDRYEHDDYDRYVEALCAMTVDFLNEHPELFEEPNKEDSREPSEEDEEAEWQWEHADDDYDEYEDDEW